MFFLLSTLLSISQENDDGREGVLNCGTETERDSYLLDRYYGDNQKLVDILLDHGVAISENYLENLDSGDEMTIMSEERFAVSRMYYIPIKAWVYRDNNGTGNISSSEVYQVIDELNSLFTPNTNIRFYLLCDISFINNSNYADNGAQYFDDYTLINKVTGAINVHFVKYSTDWGGRANFPFPLFPGIPNPRAYSCALVSLGGIETMSRNLGHEIGHTLGLFHTHEPGRSYNHSINEDCGDCYQESVSRSRTQGLFCVSTVGQRKCEVNGDFLCDTEADPYSENRVGLPPECDFEYFGTDNWGDVWMPDTSNIMSYARLSCLSYFSPLQVAKMYGYISDIGINPPSFSITGPNYICNGQTATFSVNTLPGVNYYDWQVPNNVSILSGQGTSSVTVQANYFVSGQISVTPNCARNSIYKTLYMPNNIPIVDGPDEVCVLHHGVTYTASNIPGVTYSWSITNGTILSGQGTNQVSVSFTAHPSNQSLIQVTTSMCGSSGGGALGINHIPPGPDCSSVIVPGPRSAQEEPVGLTGNMRLYPNPATAKVTIEAPDENVYDLVLFNALGQAVYRKNKAIQGQYSLNTTNYEDGIYFVFLIGEKTYTKRLIIKK